MGRKGRKNKTQTMCVYCGRISICKEEHVIPQCLFPPDKRPPKSDFVIIPACEKCNNLKARDDTYIRDLLVGDLETTGNSVVQSVLPGVVRSIHGGWSEYGRVAGAAGRYKAAHGLGGIYLGHYLSVPVQAKRVNRFFRHLVRGLYWKLAGVRIPDEYVISVKRQVDPDAAKLVKQFIKWRDEGNANGPFRIGHGVFGYFFSYSKADSFTTFWLFVFYDCHFYAVATDKPSETM